MTERRREKREQRREAEKEGCIWARRNYDNARAPPNAVRSLWPAQSRASRQEGRLPPSPVRARGRQEVVGAHDTEQPGFAKVNAPSFPREGYGVCHHSPSLCLTLLCLLLIAEVTTPNRVRLLPQSTLKTFLRKLSFPPCAAPRDLIHYVLVRHPTGHGPAGSGVRSLRRDGARRARFGRGSEGAAGRDAGHERENKGEGLGSRRGRFPASRRARAKRNEVFF